MPRPRKQQNAPIHGSPTKQALVALGEDENVACVVAALLEDGPATTSDLQERTWYSVAPINSALKELGKRGWVKSEAVATEARGRNPQQHAVSGSKAALRRHYKAVFDERLGVVEKHL